MEKRSGGGVEGGGSGASAPRAGGAGISLENTGCFFGVSRTGGLPDCDGRRGTTLLRYTVCGGADGASRGK